VTRRSFRDRAYRDAMRQEDVAALPNAGNRRHNAMLRASYAVEDPLAPRILMPTDTTGLSLYDYAIDRFGTAFVAIAKGNTGTANLALAQLKARIDAAKVLSVVVGRLEYTWLASTASSAAPSGD